MASEQGKFYAITFYYYPAHWACLRKSAGGAHPFPFVMLSAQSNLYLYLSRDSSYVAALPIFLLYINVNFMYLRFVLFHWFWQVINL